MNTVLVIVIGDPERGIASVLEDGWLAKRPTRFIPAVQIMRGTDQWISGVSEKTFLARHGRRPLEGEIGCAIAHVNAYQQFLRSAYQWAIVLESDIRITNQEELSTAIEAVVANFPSVGQIFSLYSESPLSKRSSTAIGNLTISRLATPPQGGVAYMLDRPAAKRLLEAQSPIVNVADWPITAQDTDFYFIQLKGIAHPTDEVQSTVAPGIERSTLVPWRVRLQMWLGVWYAQHWSSFSGPQEYYYVVLQPRILRMLRRFRRDQS